MNDPLSDVLSLLDIRNYTAGAIDAAGDWSVQFDAYKGVKCYAVVSGQCWLVIDGVTEVLHLQKGDCFVLSRERTFRATSNRELVPVDFAKILATSVKDGVAYINGGGECFIAGGHFVLFGDNANFLLEQLPPVFVIKTHSEKEEIRWALKRLKKELGDPKPGSRLVAQNLAHMMLLQVLRLHLVEGAEHGTGWLKALADQQMNAAISVMHSDPAHNWTVTELAHHTGMSRSVFALKFKRTVGKTPMEYLTLWRMMLAGDKLKRSSDSISGIASSLGYESQSSFGKVFKKAMGCSPRQYSRTIICQ